MRIGGISGACPIKKFEVKNMPLREAVWKLRQAMNKDYLPYTEQRYKNSNMRIEWSEKRVTLKAAGATPREILSRLVAQHGEVIWSIRYQAQVGPVPAIEETCTIVLIPFPGLGGVLGFPPFPRQGQRGIARGPRGPRGQ